MPRDIRPFHPQLTQCQHHGLRFGHRSRAERSNENVGVVRLPLGKRGQGGSWTKLNHASTSFGQQTLESGGETSGHTHVRLPAKTKELLLLQDEAQKASGPEEVTLNKKIADKAK